jgi:cobalt-zinc-cadmium efflux system outer membrane protein
MVRNIVVLSLVVAVIVGCTTFHERPICPEASASSFESRRLGAHELQVFMEASLHQKLAPWPPAAWGLDLLALAACHYHPDLDVARAQWKVAEAGIVTARAYPNPTLGIAPQYTVNATSGLSPWVLNLLFELPIETAGRHAYRTAQARSLSSSAQWKMAAVAWQVRSRVRKRLLGLHAAIEKERILEEKLALQEQTVRLLETRLNHGEISQVESDKGHIAQDQARLSVGEAQQRISEDRVALAEAVGVPEAALDGITLSYASVDKLPPHLPPADVRKAALLSRPDLLSLLSEYDAAQSALQLEIARQYPDLTLGPGYEFDQGQNKWGLYLAAAIPVFNRNLGPIAEAEAKRREAAARFDALQIQVIGEIGQTTVRYAQGLDVVKVADTILARHKAQEKAAQALFDAGDIDRLELFAVKLGRNAAELSRLDALTNEQEALGSLEDAVMRPLVCEGLLAESLGPGR